MTFLMGWYEMREHLAWMREHNRTDRTVAQFLPIPGSYGNANFIWTVWPEQVRKLLAYSAAVLGRREPSRRIIPGQHDTARSTTVVFGFHLPATGEPPHACAPTGSLNRPPR